MLRGGVEGHRGGMKGTEGYGDGRKYLGFVKSPVDLDLKAPLD